jgi:hypothetical protein
MNTSRSGYVQIVRLNGGVTSVSFLVFLSAAKIVLAGLLLPYPPDLNLGSVTALAEYR